MTAGTILEIMRAEGLETSPEIAGHLGVTTNIVSALLNRLLQKGYVAKNGIFHEHERRSVKPINRWKLTEAGRAVA